MISNKPIILFDGDCAFCNTFINYVIETDGGYFKLATQNSEQFNLIAGSHGINTTGDETIYVVQGDQVFQKSKAIRIILSKLDLKGRLMAFFMQLIPRFIADFGYGIVSKYRRSIIKQTACSLPSQNFRSRLV